MSDYGFFDEEGTKSALARLGGLKKAEAFLSILDRTIDDSANAPVPVDLTEALDRIRQVAPRLENDPRFRRLWSACRRR